jgi:hypothetical protein
MAKGDPFNQALATLTRLLPREKRVTGRARNEPCRCGSGAKWKHCHGSAKRRA